jgi:hypothetical protein
MPVLAGLFGRVAASSMLALGNDPTGTQVITALR